MTFVIDEIKHLLRCAHCLNHGASNRVIIQDKKAPNGEDAGPNGEAIAYMCDTHKDLPPKFAHQIVDGNINNINVEQLADMPVEPAKQVEEYKQVVKSIVVKEKPIVKETDAKWK